jgi:hypothetical protein
MEKKEDIVIFIEKSILKKTKKNLQKVNIEKIML